MVDILLSTYNGEKYLSQQLDSLIEQTYPDWKILIRDDGSTDQTLDVIEYYTKLYPSKIVRIKDGKGNIGSTLSFATLLEISESEYIMFCDQDDIWLPNKILLTYSEMKKMELSYPNVAVMVFTDLVLYRGEGEIINQSFIRFQNMDPLVVDNPWKCQAMSVAPGCVMMINSISKKYLLPIPHFFVHDHWIACNISFYGKCKYIDQVTINYRIHAENSVGVNTVNVRYLLHKFRDALFLYSYYNKFFKAYSFRVKKRLVIYYKIKLNIFRLFRIKLYR